MQCLVLVFPQKKLMSPNDIQYIPVFPMFTQTKVCHNLSKELNPDCATPKMWFQQKEALMKLNKKITQ